MTNNARMGLAAGMVINMVECFIFIRMAGFSCWLTKPITTLFLFLDLGPAVFIKT